MKKFLDEEMASRKFKIKYLISKYEGFEELWRAFNKMHELCDKDAYFVQHSNDEMRFLTKNWDEKLEKYVGMFADDFFRLRLSMFKLFNYFDFKQALQFPENFAIHTKKWIDITGWCDCHSADLYQQMIALYLSRGCPEMSSLSTMMHRDIPIFDIEIGGLEAGAGEDEAAQALRWDRAIRLWTIAMSKPIQELMQYQANLLRAAILTHGQEDLIIADKKEEKIVEIYKVNDKKHAKLIHRFATYERKINYDMGVSDPMRENIFSASAEVIKNHKMKKPKFLKKYKLNILWPIIKPFFLLKSFCKNSK